jgi:hypothetical protein
MNAFIPAVLAVVIVLLAGALFIARRKIKQLRADLAECERQRQVPMLMLEIDWNAMHIYMRNEGFCAARDIQVKDAKCGLDYDFKKVLVIKFEPVAVLAPREKVRLDFRAFDGDYAIPSEDIENLFAHLSGSSFEAQIFSLNPHDVGFVTTIEKRKNKFFIKANQPAGPSLT